MQACSPHPRSLSGEDSVPDSLLRTSRELFLSALAGGAINIETWVFDRMTSLLEEEDVRAGTRIFAAGEEAEFIYYMRQGRIRLVRDGGATWTFEGRWAIGAFDAVMNRPHARTAIALSDLRLMKLRSEHWLELLEDSFELARANVTNIVGTVAGLEARRWATQPEPRGSVVAPVPPLDDSFTFVDRLALLTEAGMFRDAGVQVLADVASVMEEMTFDAGQRIEGEAKRRALLVLAGQVVADRRDPNISVVFGPGSVVCGAAALGEPVHAWNARAISPVRVLAIRLEDWFDLMEEHFDLVRSALGALARVRESILEELAADAGEVRLG
jgi:CRP-like cAMP-binding protein